MFFYGFFMELLLLVVVLSGFIVNVLVTRHLLSQIAEKIQFTQGESPTASSAYTTSLPPLMKSSTYNPLMKNSGTGVYADKPVKNDVMEQDLNDIEFSEQSFATLPKDLKFEVEGGDSATPPGFEETEGKS